jgi:2Fe-2S ferredoxin
MGDRDDELPPFTVSVRTREGEAKAIPAIVGNSLMETIRAAGIDEVLAICGGCCSCGTCHVYVEGGRAHELPPMSDDEEAVLGLSDYREANSRLSCQIRFTPDLAGLELTIAPED